MRSKVSPLSMGSSPLAEAVWSSTAPERQSTEPSRAGTAAPERTMGAGMDAPSRQMAACSGPSMRPCWVVNSIMPAPGMMLRPATTWSQRKARAGAFRSEANLHSSPLRQPQLGMWLDA